MSLTELQGLRNDRAAEQAGDYSFRLVNVAGYAVVYVTSHKPGKDGICPIYTVHSDGRCNCPDFQHRCSKVEGLKCKHGLMVEQWLADCSTPEVETLEAPTCHGCGEPAEAEGCTFCGSSLIAATSLLPVATPEQAALAAKRTRYAADVAAGLWG